MNASSREWYCKKLQELVMEMDALGLVVTVERVPLTPLAMGNHMPKVEVRTARFLYSAKPAVGVSGTRPTFVPDHVSENSDGTYSLGGHWQNDFADVAKAAGRFPAPECRCGQCSICRAGEDEL